MVIFTGTLRFSAVCRMEWIEAFANPVECICNRYSPAGRLGKSNSPVLSVMVDVEIFVPRFVRLALAPTMAAPAGSCTTPWMLLLNCAKQGSTLAIPIKAKVRMLLTTETVAWVLITLPPLDRMNAIFLRPSRKRLPELPYLASHFSKIVDGR